MVKVIVIAAIGVITALIFKNDIEGLFAAENSNSVSKDHGKKGKNAQQEPPSDDIQVKEKWEMPDVLTEISGVTYFDKDRVACIQDELGTIFIYSTTLKKVEREIPFGGTGDYEGIALAGETIYVARADGMLFGVSNFKTGKVNVQEYKTGLTVEQNVEGLCFDKDNDRLLIAIKDDEPGNKDYKGIYAFDLKTKKMAARPVFKIYLGHEIFSNTSSKKRGSAVSPSAIAVHPTTKDIYITDGPKSKLLIMDGNGIKNLYQLNEKDFPQPEGICFDPEGNFYISSEGKKTKGTISSVEITKP